jgi:hypothetical protein
MAGLTKGDMEIPHSQWRNELPVVPFFVRTANRIAGAAVRWLPSQVLSRTPQSEARTKRRLGKIRDGRINRGGAMGQ